jgi:hypothetical protein
VKEVLSRPHPHLLTLIPTDAGEDVHPVILAIQSNCKYYNYEIFRSPPASLQPIQLPPAPDTTINAEIVQIIENNHGTVTGKSP